jgi:hypothetical protein
MQQQSHSSLPRTTLCHCSECLSGSQTFGAHQNKKRRRHLTQCAASRCCCSRLSFGCGTSTILVSDVNVVAALMCEVPPKRRRHLTHRAASCRHRSRSLFGWRTSTLFCWQGCLSQARPCNNITLSVLLMFIVVLAPGTIDRMMTMTATTAKTTTTTTDSTVSSCGHGCTLMALAAAAAGAENMPWRQQQLGTRNSDGDGNDNGAAAVGQPQWWQQWRSAMEKCSSGCVLTDLGSALADSGSVLADLGCALMTWAAPPS